MTAHSLHKMLTTGFSFLDDLSIAVNCETHPYMSRSFSFGPIRFGKIAAHILTERNICAIIELVKANCERRDTMRSEIITGLALPFAGTALGAGCVLFMKRQLGKGVQRALTGFASGVMVAASIWSLLIPAMEQASDKGKFSFLPAVIGFWCGVIFLLLLDSIIPHLHMDADKAEGLPTKLTRTTMMVLAVTLHNIPEGMAVGIVYAGFLSGSSEVTAGGAFALSLGIAIQNFPEGAIISMPIYAGGKSKGKAFASGVLSGAVEPIGAAFTMLFAGLFLPAMPYLMSFAAGAMLYVVVEELIPEMSQGEHSNVGVLMFSLGFTLMMALDVALG